MNITMTPSSYTELTPVSSTCSSADDFSVTQHTTKLNEFHQFVAELGFDDVEATHSDDADDVQFLEAPVDYESDEDLNVEYPYQRKDKYAGLQERVAKDLEEREIATREIDVIAEDVTQQLKLATERRKMESRQIGTIFTTGSLFQCAFCAKSFPTSDALQLHTQKAHDLSGNKFQCDICGNRYKLRKNLLLHLKIHQKEFACDKCNLVFQTTQTLQRHVVKEHSDAQRTHQPRVEVDQADFINKICRICKKAVPEGTWKQHEWYCANKTRILEQKREKAIKSMSVPTSPALSVASVSSFVSCRPTPSSPVVSYRDKSCKVCGESFASRQSMIRHVGRKHPEAKNDPDVTAVRYVSVESPSHQYACEDCGKRLTNRAALTYHRSRAHLKTARHECPECQKTFIVPSELKKHIQRVHEKTATSTSELPDLDSIF